MNPQMNEQRLTWFLGSNYLSRVVPNSNDLFVVATRDKGTLWVAPTPESGEGSSRTLGYVIRTLPSKQAALVCIPDLISQNDYEGTLTVVGNDAVIYSPSPAQITLTFRPDRAVLQDIWDGDPLLRRFLGTIDNPEFILYKMIPHRVRFMREWALDYHDVTM